MGGPMNRIQIASASAMVIVAAALAAAPDDGVVIAGPEVRLTKKGSRTHWKAPVAIDEGVLAVSNETTTTATVELSPQNVVAVAPGARLSLAGKGTNWSADGHRYFAQKPPCASDSDLGLSRWRHEDNDTQCVCDLISGAYVLAAVRGGNRL